MSGSRRRKATSRAVGAAAPAEAQLAPLETRLRRDLTAGIKRRLGLRASEDVPAEVQGLVDSAAREIVGNSVASALVGEVTKLRPSRFSRSSGPDAVGTLPEVSVLQEAERLAAKKKALRIAGFSNEEAMRLLVAEVAGLASQTTA
jgi:hypothetical protein